MKLLTPKQVRELDRQAIEEIGIPGPVLMETAGRGVADAICEIFAACKTGQVVVLAGKGNNGGDGYVIARTLRDRGWSVRVIVLVAAREVRGDAAIHLRALKKSGADVVHAATTERLARNLERSCRPTLLVDALLGTGISSEVGDLYRQAIDWCNAQTAPVVAVDIPSGVSADSGAILGTAVQAAMTVTFVAAKPGLVSYPGAACCGELRVVEIGIPQQRVDSLPTEGCLVDYSVAQKLVPVRPTSGHKGSFGHLLVLAGSQGKSGAALLTASGGLRSGAGLVTLALPKTLQQLLVPRLGEAMSLALHDSEGAASSAAYETLVEALRQVDVLALGPGLGTNETTQLLVQRLVRDCDKPLVIDADGLNALCGHLDAVQGRHGVIPVMTPHPGEMARLTGRTVAELEASRLEVACEFAQSHRAVIVLKGARTVVAGPDGRYAINASGNPGLASGGMGDVLTGVIGGLLAQGLEPFEAALLGVYLHGAAADRLALRCGNAGLLASDVAAELPAARYALTRKEEESC